jgi:hypothetical protein
MKGGSKKISNSDPITGQAGWYDVRVRLRPAGPDEPPISYPQATTPASPGQVPNKKFLAYFTP